MVGIALVLFVLLSQSGLLVLVLDFQQKLHCFESCKHKRQLGAQADQLDHALRLRMLDFYYFVEVNLDAVEVEWLVSRVVGFATVVSQDLGKHESVEP